MKKIDSHIIRGMTKDAAVSIFKPDMAIDAHNIRLGIDSDNSLYTISNEKGTGKVDINWSGAIWNEQNITSIEGTILGSCYIDKYLVIFTKGVSEDTIYKFEYSDNIFNASILYRGNLNFSISNPIECIGHVEGEQIIKVYWVDGINQLRFINILEEHNGKNSSMFDIIPSINNTGTFTVTNNPNGGQFDSGVIQYVVTYIDKFGQESNIAYVSPLYYTYKGNRAGSPEESTSNSFVIKGVDLDTSFNYVRVYSIFRTSLDSEPITKLVNEFPIKKNKILVSERWEENTYPESREDDIILTEHHSFYIWDDVNPESMTVELLTRDASISAPTLKYRSMNDLQTIAYAETEGYWDFYEQNTVAPDVQVEHKYLLEQYFAILETDSFTTKEENKTSGWVTEADQAELEPTEPNTSVQQEWVHLSMKRAPSTTEIGGSGPAGGWLVARRYYDELESEFEIEVYKQYTAEGAKEAYPDTGSSFTDLVYDNNSSLDPLLGQVVYSYNKMTNRLEVPKNVRISTDYTSGEWESFKKGQIAPRIYIVKSSGFKDPVQTPDYDILLDEGNPLKNWGSPYRGDYLNRNSEPLYIAVKSERLKNFIVYKDGSPIQYYKENSRKGQEYTIIGKITKWKWKPIANNEHFKRRFAAYIVPPPYNNGTESSSKDFRNSYGFLYISSGNVIKYPPSESYGEDPPTDDWNRGFDCNEFPQEASNAFITPFGVREYKGTNWYLFDGGYYGYRAYDGRKEGKPVYPIPNVTKSIVTKTWKQIIHEAVYRDSISFEIIDSGRGESVDPTEILLKNREIFYPYTMAVKNNVLFLGNIKLSASTLDKELLESLKEDISKHLESSLPFIEQYVETDVLLESSSQHTSYYSYNNQLRYDSSKIKGFKYLDTYRLGVQFKNSHGIWSPVVYISDYKIKNPPKYSTILYDGKNETRDCLCKNTIIMELPTTVKDLTDKGFISARPVVVFPTIADRDCIAQGVVCPTVFNVKDRANHSPDVQASWFFRPMAPVDIGEIVPEHSESANLWYYDVDTLWKNVNDLSDKEKKRSTISQWYTSGMDYYDEVSSSIKQIDTSKSGAVTINQGSWIEFRHWYPIPEQRSRCSEIQGILLPDYNMFTMKDSPFADISNEQALSLYVENRSNHFGIDENVVTLNSPELEFNESIASTNLDNVKFRIIGMIPIQGNQSKISLELSKPTGTYTNHPGMSFPGLVEVTSDQRGPLGWRSLASSPSFIDKIQSNDDATSFYIAACTVYPWQRAGSFSTTGDDRSVLSKKIISNLRFSPFNTYLNEAWNTKLNLKGVAVFNSENIELEKIGELNYYGNVDTMLLAPTYSGKGNTYLNFGDEYNDYYLQRKERNVEGYYLTCGYRKNEYFDIEIAPGLTQPVPQEVTSDLQNVMCNGPLGMGYFFHDKVKFTNYPRISYKSTPHFAIGLGYDENQAEILPRVKKGNEAINMVSISQGSSGKNRFFSTPKVHSLNISVLEGTNTELMFYMGRCSGFLYLGELYHEPVNRFGGTSDSAIQNNSWVVGGNEVTLNESDTKIKLVWSEGDTYVQRYDCLKTYPFSEESTNQLVEVLSFMVETRINLDGIYSKNRGLKDNTSIRPTNFNKRNSVYDQGNDFFTYRVYDDELLSNTLFPSEIVWSSPKINNSNIDQWTNILLSSSYDINSRSGSIESLKVLDDNVYCFQEKAVGVLLYNNRSLLPVSDGVPVEISNGTQMQGIRYLSQTVGCQNKWSTVVTPNGIYFMDGNTQSIYLINQNSVTNLTDNLGMVSWINNQDIFTKYSPKDYKGFTVMYDTGLGDLYYSNAKESLMYSEKLKQFVSFMDYSKIDGYFNMKGDMYCIRDSNIWKLHAGEYNSFFGSEKGYSMSFISNPSFNNDKVFTNLSVRGDFFEGDTLLTEFPFTTIKAENEYQIAESGLENRGMGIPSPLKRKFRLWGINIPRINGGRDRIRNMWSKITLSNNSPGTKKMTINSFDVIYYM